MQRMICLGSSHLRYILLLSWINQDGLFRPCYPPLHSNHDKKAKGPQHHSVNAERQKALQHHLLALFPAMDPQLFERALEASDYDLDSAIKTLNELRFVSTQSDMGLRLKLRLSQQPLVASLKMGLPQQLIHQPKILWPMNGLIFLSERWWMPLIWTMHGLVRQQLWKLWRSPFWIMHKLKQYPTLHQIREQTSNGTWPT